MTENSTVIRDNLGRFVKGHSGGGGGRPRGRSFELGEKFRSQFSQGDLHTIKKWIWNQFIHGETIEERKWAFTQIMKYVVGQPRQEISQEISVQQPLDPALARDLLYNHDSITDLING